MKNKETLTLDKILDHVAIRVIEAYDTRKKNKDKKHNEESISKV